MDFTAENIEVFYLDGGHWGDAPPVGLLGDEYGLAVQFLNPGVVGWLTFNLKMTLPDSSVVEVTEDKYTDAVNETIFVDVKSLVTSLGDITGEYTVSGGGVTVGESGLIGTVSGTVPECDNGESRCFGGVRQTCVSGTWVSDPCPAGQYCESGACIDLPADCAVDSDCPTGYSCINGECVIVKAGFDWRKITGVGLLVLGAVAVAMGRKK